MKEEAKEWVGIKPADLVIYLAFLLVIPVFFLRNAVLDTVLLSVGLLLCLVSCWIGMKPHPELSRTTNRAKLLSYPVCTLLFLYLGYLNFTAWQ